MSINVENIELLENNKWIIYEYYFVYIKNLNLFDICKKFS